MTAERLHARDSMPRPPRGATALRHAVVFRDRRIAGARSTSFHILGNETETLLTHGRSRVRPVFESPRPIPRVHMPPPKVYVGPGARREERACGRAAGVEDTQRIHATQP